MAVLRLPGLLDPHVHFRDPGAPHKEDWDSGTAAALAGGFTGVLDMPNTVPPVVDAASLGIKEAAARARARCDWGLHLGARADNVAQVALLAPRATGLKCYLDDTFGPLRVADPRTLQDHAQRWPASGPPLLVHAEGLTLAAALRAVAETGRALHVCHLSTREDLEQVRAAKAQGLPVTCEVTPHHLFLHRDNVAPLAPGRAEVRPALATAADCAALRANLALVDVLATDHAPHTRAEKDGAHPPPGFPGLETALPLYLALVREGWLSLEGLVARCCTNVRRIFQLPPQPDTWIEVDPEAPWRVREEALHTRAGWSPFAGWPLQGRVQRVVLRGQEAFRDGVVLAAPGSGRPFREQGGD